MKRTLRYGLLAGASGLALGIGLATAPAQAFDEVTWTWDNTVTTEFVFDPALEIDWNIDPEGLVMVESIQLQVGDVKAKSIVWDVTNKQPEINNGSHNLKPLWGYPGHGGEDDDVAGLDAVEDLPEVVSVATAVANNLSVTSDSATMMNNGQYAFGDFDDPDYGHLYYDSWETEEEWHSWYLGKSGSETSSGESLFASGELANAVLAAAGIAQVDTGNSHHDALATATILASLGLITKGDVEAVSIVGDVYNASVDSSATAVSNNISVSVNPAEEIDEDTEMATSSWGGGWTPPGGGTGGDPDDLLIADYTQFSYMDVNSVSKVLDVDMNNYSNLGAIDQPVVNSTATSIGNNISVNVGN